MPAGCGVPRQFSLRSRPSKLAPYLCPQLILLEISPRNWHHRSIKRTRSSFRINCVWSISVLGIHIRHMKCYIIREIQSALLARVLFGSRTHLVCLLCDLVRGEKSVNVVQRCKPMTLLAPRFYVLNQCHTYHTLQYCIAVARSKHLSGTAFKLQAVPYSSSPLIKGH